MNPFFINSALIFDHFEAVARAHERMFDMMDRRVVNDHDRNRFARNQQLGNYLHREEQRGGRTPRSLSTGHRRPNTAFQSYSGIENRTSEKTSKQLGVRRQDTLAREGIKPFSGPRSSSKIKRSVRGEFVDESGSSIFSSSNHLGQGWYSMTSSDSGEVLFRGTQILVESMNRLTFLTLFNPGKVSTTCNSVSLHCKILPESENMINFIVAYQSQTSFYVLSFDVLQKTISLYRLSVFPQSLQGLCRQSLLIWQETILTPDINIVNHRFYKYQIEIDKSLFILRVNDITIFQKEDYPAALRDGLPTLPNQEESGAPDTTDLSRGHFGFLMLPNQQIYLKEVEIRSSSALQNPLLSPSLTNPNKKPSPPQRQQTSKVSNRGQSSSDKIHNTDHLPASLVSNSEKGIHNHLLLEYENKKSVSYQEQLKKQLIELKYDVNIIDSILQDMVISSSSTSENKRITFEDIAGLKEAKRLLHEAILLPFLMPEYFTGIISESWKGILLFGPAGTGKTLLAKSIVHCIHHCCFFNCSIANLISKWRGESEKLIKCLFEAARLASPSIIFFDEIDALVISRGSDNEHEASRRMKTELFSQMDGLHHTSSSSSKEEKSRVFVLATTNCPWDLDTAILRRLEKRVYVPLPDLESRQQHFELCLRTMNLELECKSGGETETSLEQMRINLIQFLSESSEGYSGADIVTLCREAAMIPMRRLLSSHSMDEIQKKKEDGSLKISAVSVIYDDFVEDFSLTCWMG